jgi:hypothetical protein
MKHVSEQSSPGIANLLPQYGIVQKHRGRIEVRSEVAKGGKLSDRSPGKACACMIGLRK